MPRILRGRRPSFVMVLAWLLIAAATNASERDGADLERMTRLHLSSVEESGTCLTSDDVVIGSVSVDNDRAVVEAVVELTGPGTKMSVVHRTVEWEKQGTEWRPASVTPTEEKLAASVSDQDSLARLHERLEQEVHLRNTVLTRALTTRALQLSNAAKAELAQAVSRMALEISGEIDDLSGTARALLVLSIVERNRSRFAEALILGNDAVFAAERADDVDAMARGLLNLGRIHGATRDRVVAAELYRKALALEPRIHNKQVIVTALMGLGTNAGLQEDYLSALRYYYRAAATAREIGNRADEALAEYNIASVSWRQNNDAERALSSFQKALPTFRETNSKFYLLGTLTGSGDALRVLHEPGRARQYYEEALGIANEIEDSRMVAYATARLGQMDMEAGKLDSAWSLLEEAAKIGETTGDTEIPTFALWRMAEIRIRQNDSAGAVLVAEKAVAAAKKSGLPVAYAEAVTVASRAYRSAGRIAEAETGLLEAIRQYEKSRERIVGGATEMQRGFEDKVSPYLELVDLLAARGQTSRALEIAEKSKARLLLDVLQTGRNGITKLLTAEEKKTDQAFRNEIAQLNRAIQAEKGAKSRNETRLAELTRRLEAEHAAFDAFETTLYVRHPELKVTRGRTQPLQARDLESLELESDDVAIVEYVVTGERTHVFLIAAERRSKPILLHTVPIGSDALTRSIETFSQQLSSGDLAFRSRARELYRLLFAPIAGKLGPARAICIVPDGPLWKLPFQVLLDEKDRFLIERFAVFYAPSISVLTIPTGGTDTASGRGALLAFGNPTVGANTVERVRSIYRSDDLGSLPEAETEVRSLAKLYGPGKSRVLVGAAAAETTAKAEMGRYGIVHFATHGVLNNRNPLYSHLLLTASEDERGEDGLLEAWEMLDLDLNADLVVLSACETARGRVGAGEGLIGMAWAMFVAGARATVASQWKVESESTTRLMIEFHRRLSSERALSSRGKAEALRRAQLTLMRDPDYRHPYYWSPFVFVATRW